MSAGQPGGGAGARTGETLLGAVVLAVAIGFFSFALTHRSDAGTMANAKTAFALFNRVDGIAAGSDVRLAGVKIGAVSAVSLTPENVARLDFALSPAYQIPGDSVARIATDGLLGGAYVAIEPGPGVDGPLAEGGEIVNTNGAVDLLSLLGAAAQTMGGGGGGQAKDAAPQ